MVAARDLADLGKLIATTHGWPAARAFKAYAPSDEAKAIVARKGTELLRIFPKVPGACAPMSAAFAAHLERDLAAPVYVIAGALVIEGEPVFGDGRTLDEAPLFSAGAYNGNGHVWVMVGPWVADISIFRTAFSADSPPALARHASHHFAPTTGMIFERWRQMRQLGFDYRPHHVLSEAEVTGLLAHAQQLITGGEAPARV